MSGRGRKKLIPSHHWDALQSRVYLQVTQRSSGMKDSCVVGLGFRWTEQNSSSNLLRSQCESLLISSENILLCLWCPDNPFQTQCQLTRRGNTHRTTGGWGLLCYVIVTLLNEHDWLFCTTLLFSWATRNVLQTQYLSSLIIKASHLIAFQFHLDKCCLIDISCYIQRHQQSRGVVCQKKKRNGQWSLDAARRPPPFTKQINKWRISSLEHPPRQNSASTRKRLQDSVYKILIKEVVR